MALETLKDLKKVGNAGVMVVQGNESCERSATDFIDIDLDKNTIKFKVQKGPIKEVGVNGCQVDDMISVIRDIIAGLNKEFPCRENSVAVTKLDEAGLWLLKRKLDRKSRGVEGTNQE